MSEYRCDCCGGMVHCSTLNDDMICGECIAEKNELEYERQKDMMLEKESDFPQFCFITKVLEDVK